MRTIWSTLILPALIGLGLTLPFALLEIINRWNFHEEFPFSLFGGMWLLAAIFSVVLLSLLQSLRMGDNLLAQPVSLLLRIALLLFTVVSWANILIDQWPCFMGIPICD